ncbi:hypothetical protein DIPPA_35423 [Diplonema papillatum]|nr:hypothetical protein DIPPA_35423 [Diplonema papillatum]
MGENDKDSDYSSSSSSNWDAPPVEPKPSDGGMDMSMFEGKDRFEDLEKAERELAGDMVTVQFALPDGERVSSNFPHGQTVQFLKVWLEENHKYAYENQVLTLNGDLLIDPLSLNDIRGFKTGGVVNEVVLKMKEK